MTSLYLSIEVERSHSLADVDKTTRLWFALLTFNSLVAYVKRKPVLIDWLLAKTTARDAWQKCAKFWITTARSKVKIRHARKTTNLRGSTASHRRLRSCMSDRSGNSWSAKTQYRIEYDTDYSDWLLPYTVATVAVRRYTKPVQAQIYTALYHETSLKRSGWHVLKITPIYLPPTRLSTNGMSHNVFRPTPSCRASPHFGRHSLPVPQTIGGWVGLKRGWVMLLLHCHQQQ